MKLKLIEAQNICNWFDEFRQQEKIKALPLKVQWDLLSNVKELQMKVAKFMELRNGFVKELNDEYFSPEKSESYQDENGEEKRRIKDEYIEDYKSRVDEVNKVIAEVSLEESEYEFKPIDIDEFIGRIPDDSNIELQDIEIINIFSI